MDTLLIQSTAQTPLVNLNPGTGIMEIKGIDLEYFNITSSKRILFLLYKLNELVDSGKKAKVEWYYRQSDEDMYEVGQDYAFMVHVPFDFREYTDNDLVVA